MNKKNRRMRILSARIFLSLLAGKLNFRQTNVNKEKMTNTGLENLFFYSYNNKCLAKNSTLYMHKRFKNKYLKNFWLKIIFEIEEMITPSLYNKKDPYGSKTRRKRSKQEAELEQSKY